MRVIFTILFISLFGNIYSQQDTLLSKNTQWSHPKKASVMSALLPGLGQVYNKKYWKVPIIYGAGAFLAYEISTKNKDYQDYKAQLLNVINGNINPNGYSEQQLILLKNQSKKWRDLSIAGVVFLYILNIIDANVDAHLRSFDVSNNLTITPEPYLHQKYIGLNIRISIKNNFVSTKNYTYIWAN